MRVAIRVDASTAIGLGHLRRCLSLAEALREAGGQVLFISRELGVDVGKSVGEASFAHAELRAPEPDEIDDCSAFPPHAAWARLDWRVDALETTQALSTFNADWVVVDHYAFDARWHRMVGEAVGASVAVVDDLGDRALSAALVIDHNHIEDHEAKYRTHIAPGTVVLGGPRYALLGKPYWHASHCPLRDTVHSIGIFMGGADAGNYSALALRACREVAGFTGPVEIVTTGNNPHLTELMALTAESKSTTLVLDLPDLAHFFASHDIQIGAGGGATWERCRIGAPTLAMGVAQNQHHVLDPLESLGVLQLVKSWPPVASAMGSQLRLMIDNHELRHSLSRNARLLVDGQGALRVAAQMGKQCCK